MLQASYCVCLWERVYERDRGREREEKETKPWRECELKMSANGPWVSSHLIPVCQPQPKLLHLTLNLQAPHSHIPHETHYSRLPALIPNTQPPVTTAVPAPAIKPCRQPPYSRTGTADRMQHMQIRDPISPSNWNNFSQVPIPNVPKFQSEPQPLTLDREDGWLSFSLSFCSSHNFPAAEKQPICVTKDTTDKPDGSVL